MKIAGEIAFFHSEEFIENLLKFIAIWQFKFTNFSRDSKIISLTNCFT